QPPRHPVRFLCHHPGPPHDYCNAEEGWRASGRWRGCSYLTASQNPHSHENTDCHAHHHPDDRRVELVPAAPNPLFSPPFSGQLSAYRAASTRAQDKAKDHNDDSETALSPISHTGSPVPLSGNPSSTISSARRSPQTSTA